MPLTSRLIPITVVFPLLLFAFSCGWSLFLVSNSIISWVQQRPKKTPPPENTGSLPLSNYSGPSSILWSYWTSELRVAPGTHASILNQHASFPRVEIAHHFLQWLLFPFTFYLWMFLSFPTHFSYSFRPLFAIITMIKTKTYKCNALNSFVSIPINVTTIRTYYIKLLK